MIKSEKDQQVTPGVGTSNSIINLSQTDLSPAQRSVLRRGLKFIPTPSDLSKKDILLALLKFNRRIRLATFFIDKKSSNIRDRKFRPASTWTPPRDPRIETHLEQLIIKLDKLPLEKPKNNLPFKEKRALKELKKLVNIIIKPADKGTSVVIMDKSDYVMEVNRQLNHPFHYRPLEHPIFPDNIKKIDLIFDSLVEQGKLDEEQATFLKGPCEPTPRRLYLLPKIHKDKSSWPGKGIVPPGRPIIADCGSESCFSAQYIDHFLAPFATDHPSYIKDTFDFLQQVTVRPLPPGCALVSIDVDGLYTNINNGDGIQAIRNRFNARPDPMRPDKELLELLQINLEGNDFEFDGKWHLQTFGTSMGKLFAPHYADIFMADWEAGALAKCHLKPFKYCRYLDDIFIIWPHSRAEFDNFYDVLNTHHPSIKLKFEYSMQSINFLDTTIFKGDRFKDNNVLDSKVFFKPTDTSELLHTESYHPKHTFPGLIKSQILRFDRLCNNPEDVQAACHRLFLALKTRKYSQRFLRTIKNKTLHTDKIPGCSQKCTAKICGLCAHPNRIVVTSEVLTTPWNTKHIIKTTQNCKTSNGVYMIECAKCKIRYVGETSTPFKTRIGIHMSDIKKKKFTRSPVAIHFAGGDCTIDDVRITLLEHYPCRSDKQDKVTRLEGERKWQERLYSFVPYGLNQMPAPRSNHAMIPFINKFSETGVKAARIVKETFITLKADNPRALFHRQVAAFERSKNLRDTLCTSRHGKAEVTYPPEVVTLSEDEEYDPATDPTLTLLNTSTNTVSDDGHGLSQLIDCMSEDSEDEENWEAGMSTSDSSSSEED